MDGVDFDGLVRNVVQRTSRRSALGLLVACLVGASPESASVRARRKKKNKKPSIDKNTPTAPIASHIAAVAASVATSFDYPLNLRRKVDYDLKNRSLGTKKTCFGVAWEDIWHAGEDWFAPAGTTVRAIGDGVVAYVSPPRYNYPGSVVIIQHTLDDAQVVYSLYGHLQNPPPVAVNQAITKGATVGSITEQTFNRHDNSHLHWEVRAFYDGSTICARSGIPGPGYTYPQRPGTYGFVDPSAFVASHSGGPCAGKDCSAFSNSCNDGVCNAASQCVARPKQDGTSCGANGSTCQGGQCQEPGSDESYEFVTKWGSQGTDTGRFNYPVDVAVDSAGSVYVTDAGNNRIQKFTSSGGFITSWGSGGTGNGQFSWPALIAIDSPGNVYVADLRNDRIQKFTSSGSFITTWGTEGSGDGQFKTPAGIAIDSPGNVYVTDQYNDRIQKFAPTGTTQRAAAGTAGNERKGHANETHRKDKSRHLHDADGHGRSHPKRRRRHPQR